MKKIYLWMACGLVALARPAAGQDFRPFRAGLTYQFSETGTPGDTTHTLRLLKPGSQVGADSVFTFNMRAGATGLGIACSWQIRPDNLFGATLKVQAGTGAMVLSAANGRSLTLRPRAAVGTTWVATPGLTATMQSRGIGPVLGAATDSVVVIALSDGKLLRLSKNYGLLESPSLVAYLNGRNRARQLTLTALPERGLGRSLQGALAIYDFQPGDVFLRLNEYISSFGLCTRSWSRDSILTRTASSIGNVTTYTYQLLNRTLYIGYGPKGVGGYQCSSSSGTTIAAPIIRTLVVTNQQPIEENLLSGEMIPATTTAEAVLFTGAWVRKTQLPPTRYEQSYSHLQLGVCSGSPDSLLVSTLIGGGTSGFDRGGYANGLGLIRSARRLVFVGLNTQQLIGYRKNIPGTGGQPATVEQWGSLATFNQILPVRQGRPAATTTCFPNPFGTELTLSFVQDRPQALRIELRDMLGRVVRAWPSTTYPTGSHVVTLPTSALPAGLYTLGLVGEGRYEVLKVAKAE